MKHAKAILAGAIALLAAAMPSMAMAQTPWGNEFQNWLANHPNAGNQLHQNPYQIYDPGWRAQHPEVQQYIQSNPSFWNGMRSNGNQYFGPRLNEFLNNHPGVGAQVRANPELLYDRQFRRQHPGLQEFLQNHPNVWRNFVAGGPAQGPGGWGAYDQNRQWRNADWWHQNDPDWMYRNHPEWAENHPDWRANDGDFDDSHVWHNRGWWNDNHPDWVQRHHPNWYKHEQHQAAKEQQHQEKQQGREAKQQGNAQKQGHHKGDQGHY